MVRTVKPTPKRPHELLFKTAQLSHIARGAGVFGEGKGLLKRAREVALYLIERVVRDAWIITRARGYNTLTPQSIADAMRNSAHPFPLGPVALLPQQHHLPKTEKKQRKTSTAEEATPKVEE